ncbi:MAG: type II secretion system F family protein [Acidaminococcaceae bacterium]|nr:type II secretion system F family protein [Acidaminococcaceae bacterium]
MRLYRWKARSPGGKAYNGEYFADDEKQVIDFVHQNYGYVTNIEKAGKPVSFHRWFQPRLDFSSKERAVFFQQLATLLDAGIPIVKAIEMLAVGLSEKSRPVCHRLTLGLQSGRTLSQAMALQPEIFSAMNVSAVEAGEVSGQITLVLFSLSEFYKQQDKLLKLTRNVCIYPAFLLLLAVLTFIFFSIKLIPSFAELYRSLGVKETPLLQGMISISGLLQDHAVALSGMCMAGSRLMLLQHDRILSLILNLPGISPMRHSFLEIRFTRLLALLLRSGISFPEAVKRSSVTLTDLAMKNNAEKFLENVVRGVGITEAAVQAGTLFSKTGVEFLRIGESSGNLPDMMEEFAGLQEQELFARLRDVKVILEPALVAVIAAMVFTVMAVMLLPLFTLMTQMPEYG